VEQRKTLVEVSHLQQASCSLDPASPPTGLVPACWQRPCCHPHGKPGPDHSRRLVFKKLFSAEWHQDVRRPSGRRGFGATRGGHGHIRNSKSRKIYPAAVT